MTGQGVKKPRFLRIVFKPCMQALFPVNRREMAADTGFFCWHFCLERVRVISIARLRTLPPVHLQPIYVIVSDDPKGDLILGGASCLDAFSTYPGRRLLPGGAAGATTGSQELRPTRSSRTSVGSPQISNAHNR